jgi:diguanylate cyclase
MDYTKYTKQELIEIIDELKILNNELISEKAKEDKLDFAWTGNLGHWYFNIKTGNVVFNPLKVEALGYIMDELSENISYKFFTDKLHPDDYKSTMDAMVRNMNGEIEVYECEYRIQAKDGSWKWFSDRGKVTQWDDNGKPAFAAGIVFDITEKKEKEKNLEIKNRLLEETSITDALTGIKNRRAIMEELKLRIEQAQESNSPISIAIFDIDNFKNINDTKGHVYGDMVIKETADAISRSIRGLDAIGRYGGEEFLLILPNSNLDSARLVCERIRARIEGIEFNDGTKVTVSGGVVIYQSEDIAGFIDRADKNLYKAKRNAKNKIEG